MKYNLTPPPLFYIILSKCNILFHNPVSHMYAVPYLISRKFGMLPTPFYIQFWVLQMLIGYSTFLINIYLVIWLFNLGIFVNVKNLQLIQFVSYCCYEHSMLLTTDFVLSDHIE